MAGTDESTELWCHPSTCYFVCSIFFLLFLFQFKSENFFVIEYFRLVIIMQSKRESNYFGKLLFCSLLLM